MEIKITPKIKDYATTLALASIPVIIAYQAEIGKHIPIEYALLFTIGIGILSQLMTNKRVKDAYQDTSAGLDKVQGTVDYYTQKIDELQKEIDTKQAEIDKVAGLKALDNAPMK